MSHDIPHYLISDFGVGQSSIKGSTRTEPRLTELLEYLAKSPQYQLRVVGLSDCVGGVKEGADPNPRLRRSRARAFLELLDPSTRSRSTVVDRSPDMYAFPNDQPWQRARNRSVLVALLESHHDFEGEDVEGVRPQDKIPYAIRIWRSQADQSSANQAFLDTLIMLQDSAVDDRYISYHLWRSKGAAYALANKRRLRDFVRHWIQDLDNHPLNRRVLRNQVMLDLEFSMCLAAKISEMSQGAAGTALKCHEPVMRWMQHQMERSSSIYSAWKDSEVTTSCNRPHVSDLC